MTMLEWMKERTRKLFENTESTITTIFLVSIFGGSAGFLAYSKEALSFVLQTANTPMPLWATIALVLLLVLYVHLKIQRLPSQHSSEYIFKDYYYFPQTGAWIHKTKPATRACAKCKIDGTFSPLAISEDQNSFVCIYCGHSTQNIPKEIFTTSNRVNVIVPMTKIKR